jgi:two-component system response regulator NreC
MLLEAEAGLEVVAEAGDLGETLRNVGAYKPNVLVIDLRMPGVEPRSDPEVARRVPQVLKLVALGYTNPEIAHKLYLSVRTVESNRAHIHDKVRHASRAELAAYAREHGLLGVGVSVRKLSPRA